MQADVLIVGSGQAGVPLATRLAAAGRRVVLVERVALGGTCVNYGCTPTKTMIASARAAHVARTAGRLGVRTGEVSVELRAVVARKRRWTTAPSWSCKSCRGISSSWGAATSAASSGRCSAASAPR